jgi:mannose-1-phosphate guanylyltransferase / mannose-6-phosphate isomerase
MKVIILAGGGGTRLWPLSTDENPKQFIKLPIQNRSLFQLTLDRAKKIVRNVDIFVVTSEKYRHLVLDQATEVGIEITLDQLFLESERKNTLPAIVAGVYSSKALQEESVLVLPSDHIFGNDDGFAQQVNILNQLESLEMTLFGVRPTYPHTGYGYIETIKSNQNRQVVKSFKEKPNHETALTFVQNGYYWNAGIFMFQTAVFKQALAEYHPELFDLYENNEPGKAFNKAQTNVSIDYGLIEQMETLFLLELDSSWIDVGSWDSYNDYFGSQPTTVSDIDGVNNSVTNYESKEIVLVDVDNLIVVNHPNGLLISKKGHSQKVNQRKK